MYMDMCTGKALPSCDFWSKVDHASREENRKKQELLRNGGQS